MRRIGQLALFVLLISSLLLIFAGEAEHTSVMASEEEMLIVSPEATPSPEESLRSVIAFVSDRYGDQAIYTIDPDGSNLCRLSLTGVSRYPAWSPDGRKIAFYVWGDGLYVMNADGTNRLRLGIEDYSNPTWSPDGQSIAFQTYNGRDNDIAVLDIQSGEITNLTSNNDSDDQWPSWSPDGEYIAFQRIDPETSISRIFVIKTDGTDARQIDDLQGYNPAWSPDSRRLAFYSSGAVVVADVNGDTIQIIRSPQSLSLSSDDGLAWSPDGEQIAFVAGGLRQIYIADVNGDSIQQITLDRTPGLGNMSPTWQFVPVDPVAPMIAFIQSPSGANVRSSPSQNSAVLTVVKAGECLPITDQSVDGEWLQVRLTTGAVGWIARDVAEVRGQGVEIIPQQPSATPDSTMCIATATTNANLRTGPGTDFVYDNTLQHGESTEVTDKITGADGYIWWQVHTRSYWGLSWVRGDLVTVTGDCPE